MEVSALEGPLCFRCGDILAAPASAPPGSPPEQILCRACRLAPPLFQRAVAFGPYTGRMRDAIHSFKYDLVRPAAGPLGRRLAAAVERLAAQAPPGLFERMLVVPVPLHRARYARRGFNQARLLAAHAITELRRAHPGWQLTLAPGTLLRHRATLSQAGLTPRQRRVNLRGAFRVSSTAAALLEGRSVLLVDDILTTGATARAAASALLQAGASTVWVATLARAGRHAPDHHIPATERFSDINTLRQMPGAYPLTQFLPFSPQEQGIYPPPHQPSSFREDEGCRWEKP